MRVRSVQSCSMPMRSRDKIISDGNVARMLKGQFESFIMAEREREMSRLCAAADGRILNEVEAFAGVHRIAELNRLLKTLVSHIKSGVREQEDIPTGV